MNRPEQAGQYRARRSTALLRTFGVISHLFVLLLGFYIGKEAGVDSAIGKAPVDNVKPRVRAERTAQTGNDVSGVHSNEVHVAGSSAADSSNVETERRLDAEKKVKRRVEEMSVLARQEYAPVFQRLGLNAEQAQKAFERMKVINELAIVSGDSRMDLITAKRDFDRSFRESMTSDQYRAFRDFENARPAGAEVVRMIEFGDRNGVAVPEEERETIAAFVQSHEAYTGRTWHGAYDPLPDPKIGSEMMVPFLVGEIERYQNILREVRVNAAGLSALSVSMLERYYQWNIDNARSALSVTQGGMMSIKRP